MISVFLDTNVMVDFLVHREGFYENAAIIVSLAKYRKIRLFAAAMSFATASYLMERHYGNDIAAIKLVISNFIRFCHITVVDKNSVEYSLSSPFNDFEDGMQCQCALAVNANYIVTRNVKDFTNSPIRAIKPSDFLKEIISE